MLAADSSGDGCAEKYVCLTRIYLRHMFSRDGTLRACQNHGANGLNATPSSSLRRVYSASQSGGIQ